MNHVIEVKDLHKSYKDKAVLKGLTFDVKEGEIFGILGPNGAGKTTTIEILEGLRHPDQGSIEVLGLDPRRDAYALKERIGVQFQASALQDRLKVKEALQFFSGLYTKKGNVDGIIKKLGLEDKLEATFESLSGGWKQRVTLALATIHDPDIIFLDEPSTGLDPKARRELWELILGLKEEGKTILVTTHYMEEAERLCDRIAMFHQGRLVGLDTPKNLVRELRQNNFISCQGERLEIDDIAQLSAISRVEQEGNIIHIYAQSLQQAAAQLFMLAEQKDWIIHEFRFETGSLDDLFVHWAEEDAV